MSPVIRLVNAPDPDPSDVLMPATVGVALVSQQIPLDVISEPPLSDMLPPDEAVFCVIPVTAAVVKTGIVIFSPEQELHIKPALMIRKIMADLSSPDFILIIYLVPAKVSV